VSDQTHLWAESYERDLKDIFALQSDVAERVAGSLTVELLPGAVSTFAPARAVNPAAHEAYLKGRFYWNKRTPDGLQKAVEYLEHAVALDPAWPLAYAGLADAYLLMPQYAPVRPSEAIPKARAAAAKALELDDSLAEAHATMAMIATMYDWNWSLAEREYQRAITLSPNYATAHQWYATRLLVMDRHDEAIMEVTQAQELDPLSLIIGAAAGRVHYCAGDLEQAETQLRRTLELGPDFAIAHARLAKVLYLQQRSADAATEAREAVRLSDNPYCAAILSYLCAKGGQPEEARRILGELAARSKEAYVPPSWFAVVHAGLDERDRMFEWLETACQERDLHLLYALPDPLLADIRSDPRFADLVRRVGLPAKEK
jgi:Tfp pilus assembly protein PilF